ncbi:hypothetical protein PABG_05159 [Paracoccidioides brasiliensis Pb03]|nr:hypothetical protein PABG_05159 [Paracoccidioides brasiliensis Pb03]
MTGLPTPLTERKQSLRSHSRAVGAFPSLDKDKELEGPEQGPSSNRSMDSSSHEPGETPAPESIRESTAASEGTPSPQPQMPTPNASGMITMSVADLLAFCQQMTCHNTPINDTPVDDIKSQIREYQKDTQKATDTKAVTTFDGSNYQTWHIGILADAKVISVLEPDNAAALWEKIGVEYAAIDAYSRYIVWIYIGITNRTAVSVLRQFLDVLQATSTFPQIIRSDRGTETSMIAAAQLKLHQATDSNTSLNECYRFGTSTLNQRIESWW